MNTWAYSKFSHTDPEGMREYEQMKTGRHVTPVWEPTLDHRLRRTGLKGLLRDLPRGHTIVVCQLASLGHNLSQVVEAVELCRQRGISLVSLAESIDTAELLSEGFLRAITQLAQAEHTWAVERELAKATEAVARGKRRSGGRPRKLDDEKAEAAKILLANGKTPSEVAAILGVGRATMYRWIPGGMDGLRATGGPGASTRKAK